MLPLKLAPAMYEGRFGWKAIEVKQQLRSTVVSGLSGFMPFRSKFQVHNDDLCVHQFS